jgi:hypothetical protein
MDVDDTVKGKRYLKRWTREVERVLADRCVSILLNYASALYTLYRDFSLLVRSAYTGYIASAFTA